MPRTIAPKYQGTSVIAWPVKLRLGRPGTRTRGTIQFRIQTMIHGPGITRRLASEATRPRQKSSQTPTSIVSALPLPTPPPAAVTGGGPGRGIAGGRDAPDIRPGISPAFCQPDMPSLHTRVSGVTDPR